jgi:hypothetical protein
VSDNEPRSGVDVPVVILVGGAGECFHKRTVAVAGLR